MDLFPSSELISVWCMSLVRDVWIIYWFMEFSTCPANCTLRRTSNCFGRAATLNPWRAHTKVVDVRNASSPYTWGAFQGMRLLWWTIGQLPALFALQASLVPPVFLDALLSVIVRAEHEMGHRRKVIVTSLFPFPDHERSHMEKCAFRPVHCLNAKRGCQEELSRDNQRMWAFGEMGWRGYTDHITLKRVISTNMSVYQSTLIMLLCYHVLIFKVLLRFHQCREEWCTKGFCWGSSSSLPLALQVARECTISNNLQIYMIRLKWSILASSPIAEVPQFSLQFANPQVEELPVERHPASSGRRSEENSEHQGLLHHLDVARGTAHRFGRDSDHEDSTDTQHMVC